MKTVKKVLIATDFSQNAEIALHYAIEFVKKFKAHLILLHAYKVPVHTASVVTIPEIEEKSERDYKFMAQQKLEHLTLKMSQLSDVSYEIKVIPDFPVDGILKCCKTETVDLIIMGIHGSSGLKKYFFGSSTENVIEKADCPVLAVPDHADYNPIKNIGFAYDYKRIDHPKRLDILKELAERCNASIHVVTVVTEFDPPDLNGNNPINGVLQRSPNLKQSLDLHFDDDIEKGIYNYMDEHNIDLLTVLPRKHGFFDKLLRTSVTSRLMNHSRVPILAV